MQKKKVKLIMALPCLQLCSRHTAARLGLDVRCYATQGKAPRAGTRSQERPGDTLQSPVFQYVGKHRKPNHKVFVWGFSFTGALGLPSLVKPDRGFKKPRRYQLTPYRLETEAQISSAACGYGFTLLSSTTSDLTKLWGMGLNKDSQLGFQRTQRSRLHSYDYVLEPSPVALPLAQPQSTRVVQVACGRAHSLVLTDREGVFSMGNNAYGQCGRPIVEDEVYGGSHIIHKMEGFDSKVIQVACGQDHSLFLTETGKVYACGWGADGQTACGQDHSLFLTETGKVYACGWGADGQTVWVTTASAPRREEVGGELSGVSIKQISTYGDCSLAVSRTPPVWLGGTLSTGSCPGHRVHKINSPPVPSSGRLAGRVLQGCLRRYTEDGGVFVWGYGILGKGPELAESITPEMIPPVLFGRTEFRPSVTMTTVRCGLNHFAAITDQGELFVWGKNVRGCLGIGKKDDQYFPWRVTVPGHVVDVACGVDHMVALVKTII
ncbi:hypothetical protein CRUP_027043 [Coryphaenoides rupestris]|nr:hypothetical protein CRUP_027043 [Coryphaenoides rupestris]